jgi:hypothetical protein
MRIGIGITLCIVGAILAFAVTANTSVFNLHVAGFVFILAGLATMFIPRRNYAAVSKRLVTRRSRSWPGGTVTQTETEVPPYVTLNPASNSELPTVPSIPADPNVGAVMTPGEPATESEVVEQLRDE